MPNPLLWPIAKNVGKQIAKNVIFPKSLNKNEDLVVDEMSDPNSPMNKNIYQWTDEDFNKALSSPSYRYNQALQNKVKEYIKRK